MPAVAGTGVDPPGWTPAPGWTPGVDPRGGPGVDAGVDAGVDVESVRACVRRVPAVAGTGVDTGV